MRLHLYSFNVFWRRWWTVGGGEVGGGEVSGGGRWDEKYNFRWDGCRGMYLGLA